MVDNACPSKYGYGICAICEKASRHAYENEYSLCKECLNVEFKEIESNFKERKKDAEK